MERTIEWVTQVDKEYSRKNGGTKLTNDAMVSLFGRTDGTEREVLSEILDKAFAAGVFVGLRGGF